MVWAILLAVTAGTGCASKMERAVTGMMNQTDVILVKNGIATPILLLDGLTEAWPGNDTYKLLAAQLNVAYGSILLSENETERSVQAFLKAMDYGMDALCQRNKAFRKAKDAPVDQFVTSFRYFDKKDVPYLYYTAQAWLLWIGTDGSWRAAADVPKVERLIKLVLKLDETYNYGMAHCLLAVIYTSRPAALGGQPELAREHFEKAMAISNGRCLPVNVLYANHYCRLVYDRERHDALLQNVVAADPDTLPPHLKIMNIIAREEAQKLLDGADDYF